MTDEEPRTFADLAAHADAIREETRIARGAGYIVGPRSTADDRPKLPGFRDDGMGVGSAGLVSSARREPQVHFLPQRDDHIRFLEHVVERLAAQLSEMAQRLAEQDATDQDTICMNAVVDAVRRKGYDAIIERTGGNVATIFAGPFSADGGTYAAVAGPGTFSEHSTASPEEFYVSADGGDGIAIDVDTTDPEAIADLIIEQILRSASQ